MNAIANVVKAAVQNTSETVKGKTLGEISNVPNSEDLKKSYIAIDSAYDIVIRKDGYDDTAKKLEGLKDQIGEKVYDVLLLSIEHCEGNLKFAKSYFAMLCAKAEEYFLSKYVKQNKEETSIAKAIPLWPAYKSSMLKGLDYGMSPDEAIPDTESKELPDGAPRWPTAAKYRTEVQKREKANKEANERDDGKTRNDTKQTTNVVNLVTKGWSPLMAGAMAVMIEALNGCSHEEQDLFAPDIMAIGKKIAAHKVANASHGAPVTGEIVTDETGAVTGTTRSDASEEDEAPITDEARAALQAAVNSEKPKADEAKKPARRTRAA
jgi:hypothetical protein